MGRAIAAVWLGWGHALRRSGLVALAFVLKLRIEERFMAERFLLEYPGYRQRARALIPGRAWLGGGR